MRLIITLLLPAFVITALVGYRFTRTTDDQQGGSTPDYSQYFATSNKFMITSQGKAISEAGRQILLAGGNAFDAAAAMSFVSAVERPQSGSIGGGGMMMAYYAQSRDTKFLDFDRRVPQKAKKHLMKYREQQQTPDPTLAHREVTGIPGLVAGLLEIQKSHGKLSRQQVLAPAVELAEQGFVIYPHLAQAIENFQDDLRKDQFSRELFFDKKGSPLKVGNVLRQPRLAKTLKKISEFGHEAFYGGDIMQSILQLDQTMGGFMAPSDFSSYQTRKLIPLRSKFENYEIVTAPPQSTSGLTIINMLNMVEGEGDLSSPRAPESLHRIANVLLRAHARRWEYLGIGAFVEFPIKALMSKENAKLVFNKINQLRAETAKEVSSLNANDFFESKDTAHFNVIDGEGNIVSLTQSLNHEFGSRRMTSTGIILNNSHSLGTSRLPQRYRQVGNELFPTTALAPTLVFKQKSPMMAIGTPGGHKIASCLFHVLLNRLKYKKSLPESILARRYVNQWRPDNLLVEAPGFTAEQDAALTKKVTRSNQQNLNVE